MYEIFLPERILFGDDSIQRYAQSDFESVLIISDKTSKRNGNLLKKYRSCSIPKLRKRRRFLTMIFADFTAIQ